jgi:hypothetical protein
MYDLVGRQGERKWFCVFHYLLFKRSCRNTNIYKDRGEIDTRM